MKVLLTSKLAHESIKESKPILYEKIKEGLRKLKIGGTFSQISDSCNLKPDQVWKRLSEMQGLGMIYNTMVTRKLPSNRMGSVWQLVGLKSYTDEEIKKEHLPALDKRHNIPTQKQSIKGSSIQQNLF